MACRWAWSSPALSSPPPARLANQTGHSEAIAASREILGVCALIQGWPELADRYFRENVAYYQQTGNRRGVALMLRYRGEAALFTGHFEDAREYLSEADRWYAANPHETYLRSRCLTLLGRVERLSGDIEAAQTALLQARDLAVQARAPGPAVLLHAHPGDTGSDRLIAAATTARQALSPWDRTDVVIQLDEQLRIYGLPVARSSNT